MQARLDRTWNGEALAEADVGNVALSSAGERLALSWDIPLAAPGRAPDTPAGFTDGLWEHDVVELFLADASESERYFELEIGPRGHWLALTFDGVRARSAELRDLRLDLMQDMTDGRWCGRATFPSTDLADSIGRGPFKILFAACLGHGETRRLRCSPPLPGEMADFHQPERWADFVE